MSIRFKFLLALALCLIVVMIVGGFHLSNLQETILKQEAYNRSTMVLNFTHASREYVEEDLRPELAKITDDMIFQAKSATFATREIINYFNEQMPEYLYKQATINPLNPVDRANELEKQLINKFNENRQIEELTGYTTIGQEERFYVARPIKVESSCLSCHGNPANAPKEMLERYGNTSGYWWNVGDIISAITIYVPTEDLKSSLSTTWHQLWGSLAIWCVALSVLIYIWFGNLVGRRLQKVAQIMRKTALDPTQKKEIDERSGDEIGTVARAFNQMSDSLQELYTSLENKVKERTAQLTLAKEEAEAASLAKDQFMVNISHELRTPLNSIIGYAKIIARDRNFSPERILGLKIIEQSGIYLLTLINDILDFSKTKAGKLELVLAELHLQKFLSGIVGIIEMQAKEKGILFRYETVGRLPKKIKADEKRLRQILLNLLSNAVKFTDSGVVTLRVTAVNAIDYSNFSPEQNIRFEVIDTGLGIDRSELDKIFQAFEQVGDNVTRSSGTGLGLAISQQLVELMGSKICVESKLGHGSNFWFDLDCEVLQLAEKEPKQQDRTELILGYQGAVRRILIVDDRQENRLLLKSILQPLGFEVIEASNGDLGLQIAESSKPDLILSDLLMPKKTGLRMVIELREKPEFAEIPIIGVSASTYEIMQKNSLSVGCDEFLPKPIDESKLLALLQQYLSLTWVYDLEDDKNAKIRL